MMWWLNQVLVSFNFLSYIVEPVHSIMPKLVDLKFQLLVLVGQFLDFEFVFLIDIALKIVVQLSLLLIFLP